MFDIKKAASSVSAVNTAARVNVMHAFSINDRFARIVATAAAGSKPEQIQAGIRAQFHNVVPIAGSFVSLASDPAKQVFEVSSALLISVLCLPKKIRAITKP